jgi:ergothioneine biosynthesis protein EgtB
LIEDLRLRPQTQPARLCHMDGTKIAPLEGQPMTPAPDAVAAPRVDAPDALRADLLRRYECIRAFSELLCAPLVPEDYVVQSMPDVSPTKWHLAHTSWFFETFLLAPHSPDYQPFNPHFAYLFNSYYLTVGDRHCRQNRGQLSRPTVSEVYDYRKHVDACMRRFLREISHAKLAELRAMIELGLHHEQQHQELMLTDIKHVFWVNPLRPAYRAREHVPAPQPPPMRWARFDGGMHGIGHAGDSFAFDNESPRHRVFLDPFEIGSRLVTNGEYLAFIKDGGYRTATLWLSEGFATAQQEQWQAPQYWIQQDGQWWHHTLSGLRPVDPHEPVCHVSFFEADAFARWAGARLPSEEQWEVTSQSVPLEGSFVESGRLHPGSITDPTALSSQAPARDLGSCASVTPDSRCLDSPDMTVTGTSLRQMFGETWQWTRSAYGGYPGYHPAAGALGEYNGKFMCNQFVLRGGSCATSRTHIRRTYRNFFAPAVRWQFTGIRLSRDL